MGKLGLLLGEGQGQILHICGFFRLYCVDQLWVGGIVDVLYTWPPSVQVVFTPSPASSDPRPASPSRTRWASPDG